MKKYSFVLIILLVFILTGCSDNSKSEVNNASNISTTNTSSTSTSVSTTTLKTTKMENSSTTRKTTSKKKTTSKLTTTNCYKVFDKRVGTVYESESQCKSAGNNKFVDEVTNVVSVFECKKIQDKCGNTWYFLQWYNRFQEEVTYPIAN